MKELFSQEGFTHVFEWQDAPNTSYDEHAHQDRVSIYIIEGSVTFLFEDGSAKEVKQGERFDVPPGLKHTALVGEEGCEYIVGEMIKGDS